MSQEGTQTDSASVNGQWARGQEIKRRRLAAGIKSLREFSDATGVSRNAITSAEDGHGSKATYERLEAWLAGFDEEVGDEPDDSQLVTVEVGDIRVTFPASTADPAGVAEQVAAIVERLRVLDGGAVND